MGHRVRFFSSLDARQQLADLGYPVPEDKSLQGYAISFLLEHPAVTCVLLGARHPEYVKDAINLIHTFTPTMSFERPEHKKK